MPFMDVGDWMDEHLRAGVLVFAKRLAANDTLALSHQYGTYVPEAVAYDIAPSMARSRQSVTDCRFRLMIDSHLSPVSVTTARLVRYNSKAEARITNYGGARSPLLDPESTGALVVFAFRRETPEEPPECHAWVCDHAIDEDRVEERIGPVEPGRWRTWPDLFADSGQPAACWLEPHELPAEWLQQFPTGEKLIHRAIELRPERSAPVDVRLLHRRSCEYDLFRSLEEAVELPRVRQGYDTMESFLEHAQSVLQRRRARAGNSLELHVRRIFTEEGLVEGRDFDYRPESEPNKHPDFLFPSAAAYHNPAFPDHRLRMLAAKTTLKDRWPQVLEEARRVGTKHLLTLQEGVSKNQLREIVEADVRLVVPESLHGYYPDAEPGQILTLNSFIGDVRDLAG